MITSAICGLILLAKVEVVEPDHNRWNYLLSVPNAPGFTCSPNQEPIKGRIKVSWTTKDRLGFAEGQLVWVRVTATCRSFMAPDRDGLDSRLWLCDALRVTWEK